MKVPQVVKFAARKTVFREGSVRTVLFGPCRGLRYRIFPGYGWAFLWGGWERSLTRVAREIIQPGSIVYDIGANYGMHTLLFAKLVGNPGRVYAFEPNREIFDSLQENLRMNSLNSVVAVCKGIASESGESDFDLSENRATGHLTAAGVGSCRVPVISIDDFVLSEGAPPPAFMKIDIEGGESSALRGAVKVLDQYRPAMVVELHSPEEDRAVGAILKEFHYAAFRIQDGSRVEDLSSGWPDPKGLWGIVSCVPER